MNLTIIKMELKRNFKSFLIWSICICSVLLLGMLFFPAINAGGLLYQMEALFENPMMEGLLSAFGANYTNLGSLTGFYVTYNSIYNVLLACIFVSILAGNLLAKEEAEKTSEFLFTRPVSRKGIFLSKTAVLLIYTTALSLLYFLTSLVAMEMVKDHSSASLFLSPKDKQVLIEAVERHPEAIYEAFKLDEESFGTLSLSYAAGLLAKKRDEVAEMDLSPAVMESLLVEAAEGPEAFFSRVLEKPDSYMAMFSFAPDRKDEFLDHVRGEWEEYKAMKEDFYNTPDLFLLYFQEDPSAVLNQFASSNLLMDRAVELLELPEDFHSRIFRLYSVRIMFILCLYIFLLLIAMGSLVLFVSLLVSRGKSILGGSLGLVFFFYFINSISSAASALSPVARIMGFISPFTWMDRNFSHPAYGLSWWRAGLFLGLAGVSFLAAMRVFRKKDILI